MENAPESAAAAAYPCLEEVVGGRRHPLGRRLATMGSDRDCQIRLDDPAIRPQHAFLVFQMGSWSLRRLEAGSILRLDGSDVVEEEKIVHGARILVGKTEFVFLEKAPDPRPPDPDKRGTPLSDLVDGVAALLRERDPSKVVVDIAMAAISGVAWPRMAIGTATTL